MTSTHKNAHHAPIRRPILAAIAVITTALTTVMVATLPAFAAGSVNAGVNHSLSASTTWLGNYTLGSHEYFCAAQSGFSGPLGSTTYDPIYWLDGSLGDSWTGEWDEGPPPDISEPTGSWEPLKQRGADLDKSNNSTVTQDGRTLTGSNLNRVGYVLAKWGQTNNDDRAMRVRLLILEKFQVMYASVAYERLEESSTSAQDNRQAVDNMWDDAIANAGPYTTTANITIDADEHGGSLNEIGIFSEAGNIRSGAQYEAIIISGNAEWDATDSDTVTGTVSSTVVEPNGPSEGFHVTPGGQGKVEIEIYFPDMEDWAVGIRESDPSSHQDLMRGRLIEWSEFLESPVPVNDTFEFSIETTTSAAVAASGDTLTDELVVTLERGLWDPPNFEVDVTSTLYGPFDVEPSGTTVPAAAPAIGSVVTTIDGPGTYTTPGLVVTEPGYYVWHETSPGTVEVVDPWTAEYARPSEISLLPWSPEGTTALDSSTTTAGDTITDSVELTGGQPGATTDVTLTLYAHDEETAPVEDAAVPAGATVLDTVVTPVTFDGAGEATVDVDLDVPGGTLAHYVTVVMEISGTTTMTAYVSNYGIADETALIPWPGAATTVARREQWNVLWDEVTVTSMPSDYGALGDETELLYVDLYFVGKDYSADLADACVAENLIGTESVLAVNGRHDLTGDTWDLPDWATDDMDGTYLFVHRFAGTTRVEPFVGVCNEASETLALELTKFNIVLAETGVDDGVMKSASLTSGGLIAAGVVLLVWGSRRKSQKGQA